MIRFQFPQGHPMARVAYTPDSLAVVTAQPHTGVYVRDRFSGATLREFPLSNVADYEQLAVSECGRFLAVRHAKRFEVYDLAADGTQATSGSRSLTAAVVMNGRVRAVSRYGNENTLIQWVVPTDTPLVEFAAPPAYPLGTSGTVIAMSPDGRAGIGIRQRGKPQLIDLNTGRTVAELSFPLRRDEDGGIVGFALFSPNAEKIALGNGEKLAVFDLADFDWATVLEKPRQLYPLCELERPDPTQAGTVKDKAAEHWLPPLAFTPDGRYFLTLGLRERVQLFDATSGGVAEQWGWRMEDVTCLAVAPDGLTACAGGRRGRMTVWDLC